MPEYTDHERAKYHAMARQQIRFLALGATMEAIEHRRFLATGYLLALREVEALDAEQAQHLNTELQDVTHQRCDELYQQNQPPKSAEVHCTGHVDYDPDSRLPEDKP